MNEFIQEVDKLPIWVKILLMIPFLDIFWWVYRIIYALNNKNNISLLLSIILLIIGIPFWWLIDIIYYLLTGKIFVFDDFISSNN